MNHLTNFLQAFFSLVVKYLWTSHKHIMILLIFLTYKLQIIFLQNSYEHLTNKLETSYIFLVKFFVITTYYLNTNWLQTSYHYFWGKKGCLPWEGFISFFF